jgi:hypothetical protein
MSYGLDRHRLASHEAGHAVAAWCLGRIVTMVTLDHPATGGGASVDRMPYEALGTVRRPLATWYEVESDCLAILAGPLCEDLDHDAVSAPRSRHGATSRVPLPVTYQDHDEEPEWPELLGTDLDQLQRLTASISSSEREREALELMLTLRAQAMCETGHFKALHRRLTAALERDGCLFASDVKRALQGAELRFTMQTIPEDTDNGAQAA